MTDTAKAGASRRRFLKTAGLAGAVVAAPNVVRAQAAVKLRFQSTWPNRDIFHEFAADFVKRVNDMGRGRIELELLPPARSSRLPADRRRACRRSRRRPRRSAYWYGKNKAFSLFGTAPAFGWRAEHYLGWVRYGGGQALYEELINDVMKLNVVGLQYGPMMTQPLGWFKKEINTPAELRGLKYRTVGLAADLNRELGVAVTILPGGEIVPAIERGLIDGAEFNNPSSDNLLGFPDVSKLYYVQSYHQALESFEILFNKGKFNALPAEVQAIIRTASDASSSDMSWKAQDRYSKDIEVIKSRGVKVIKTPEPILKAQLDAWKKTIATLSADPFFKKVIDSQQAWAEARGRLPARLRGQPDDGVRRLLQGLIRATDAAIRPGRRAFPLVRAVPWPPASGSARPRHNGESGRMNGFITLVDRFNTLVGKLFAWCIVLLTIAVCYEVVSRYAFGAPTWWAFDVSWMLYGALFMMAGAYTLARNGHVRGDFLYRQWPERTQAKIDLALYVLFFFPASSR